MFVFNVVGNKPLSKLWKCTIIYRVSDLLCQVQVKIEIVHCNEAKAEYLLRFDQVTNVTARKSPTCRTSTLFFDWTFVETVGVIFQVDCTEPGKRGAVPGKTRR